MRIIHTADLHVGANRSFPNYLERHEKFIIEITELCKKTSADILVICGDILDTTNPTLEEKTLVGKLISQIPCPVAIIHGNHEWIGPNSCNTSLSWLYELTPKLRNVKMWSEPSLEEWEGCYWIAIPPQKTNRGKWTTNDFHLITKHFLDKIPKTSTLPIIGLAHEFFEGGKLENGAVVKDLAKLPRFDEITHWMLGDLHKCHPLTSNAWYCGSPLQKNFGEKLPKGVLQWDIGNEPLFIEIKTPTPLVNLKKIPKNDNWPDAYVKLECDLVNLPSTLPERVVSVAQALVDVSKLPDESKIKDIHSRITADILLKELEDFLKKRSLSEKEVKRAVKLSQKLVQNL